MITAKYFYITALLLTSLLISSCSNTKMSLAEKEKVLAEKMLNQKIKTIRIAFLAHDLAENFEEKGEVKKALKYYKQALWAFNFSAVLTGNRHPLVDDIEEAIKRMHEKSETLKDLEYIKKERH